MLTGCLCNPLLYLFEISDSRDADSISLDSSDEDRAQQRGAVTSVDEALMKVTGAAENGQEDFLQQNFGTLNQSRSTGLTMQTTSKGHLAILGQRGSEDPFMQFKVTDSRFSI